MKLRQSFVSNSSSSSFIVLHTGYKNEDLDNNLSYYNKYKGETLVITPVTSEFGWQTEEYNDFHTKAAWCYLMAKSYCSEFDGEHLLIILERTIMMVTGCDKIDWSEVEGGYIDHASVCEENKIMFQNDVLSMFLFNQNCKIVNQNDNY